jgi:thioester reductase-like protein
MKFLITGGNGLLGSHFIAHLMQQNPEAGLACLVRANDPAAAEHRLSLAVDRAIDDARLDVTARNVISRTKVICGDLTDPGWMTARELHRWLIGREPLHILHAAANLSFSNDDRQSVWATNVEATRSLLEACDALPNLASFNHISTAYVAGTRDGVIFEDDQRHPAGFHNAYEESKWTAETLVRHYCTEYRLPFRIFRPSIIIGDSTTYRISNYMGFYNVIDRLYQLTRNAKKTDFPLRLPFGHNATLDLMPIDLVVKEIMSLINAGSLTCDKTFHITNENPLILPDIISTLSRLTGVPVSYTEPASGGGSGCSALVARALQHYAPYLSQVRRFDRRNVSAVGAGRFQSCYRLDAPELQKFVGIFLARGARRENLATANAGGCAGVRGSAAAASEARHRRRSDVLSADG